MKKQMSNNIQDYPDADLLWPGRYVKAAEVKLAGRPVPLTIVRIEPRHELAKTGGSGKEYKPALFFRETDKGILLNKTNTKRLAEALGKDPRKWIGCRIVPCVERVDGFGKKTDAIRIDVDKTIAANRARPQQAPPPELEQPQDDPFPEQDEAELARLAAEAEAKALAEETGS